MIERYFLIGDIDGDIAFLISNSGNRLIGSTDALPKNAIVGSAIKIYADGEHINSELSTFSEFVKKAHEIVERVGEIR